MPVKWPSKYNKTTNRHNEWSVLKKKHADAIKKSKLNFDADLGSAVDKFENLIKKVATAGYGQTATLQDLEKVSQAGLSAKKVATSYKTKVSALPDPAKKELAAFLTEIETDAQMWADSTLFMPTVKTDLQHAGWVSVSSLADHLTTINRRGAEAQKFLQVDPSLATNQELIGLKQHMTNLLKAAAAAEGVAKRLEGLVTNANANPAYLKVLKGEAAKAVAGPFALLQRETQTLEAYLKANWVADTHMHNDENSGGKALINNLVFTKTDLSAIVAAEKTLIVA